jgi:hypothetical protein
VLSSALGRGTPLAVMGDVLAAGLAALFGSAAALKLAAPADTSGAAVRLGVPSALVAGWRGMLLGRTLVGVEILLAAGLLVPATVRVAAMASVVFLGGLGVLLARAWVLGRAVDCGCFGAAGPGPVRASVLLRNGVGAVAASLLASGLVSTRAGLGAWAVGGAAVIAALALALVLLAREHRRLLRGAHGPAAADGLTARFDPAWQLRLADGTPTNAGALLGARETLMLFTDPNCAPCERVLRHLTLRAASADQGRLVVVSRGAESDNQALAGELAPAPVVLQAEFELAEAMGVRGTPGALILGPDGTVETGPALGAQAVIDLIDLRSAPTRQLQATG